MLIRDRPQTNRPVLVLLQGECRSPTADLLFSLFLSFSFEAIAVFSISKGVYEQRVCKKLNLLRVERNGSDSASLNGRAARVTLSFHSLKQGSRKRLQAYRIENFIPKLRSIL